MSNSVYETECAQVDALIQQKKDEIKELEDLKASWSEDTWDSPQDTSEEERYEALHAELNEEAQRDDRDGDKDLHAFDSGVPVEGRDGREDANKLGEQGQVEDAAVAGGDETVEAGTFEQKDDGSVVDKREEEKSSDADKKGDSKEKAPSPKSTKAAVKKDESKDK